MLRTSAIFHKPEVLVLGATRNRKTKTDYRHDDRAFSIFAFIIGMNFIFVDFIDV